MSDPSQPGRSSLQDGIKSRALPTLPPPILDPVETMLAITKEHGQHLMGLGEMQTIGTNGSMHERRLTQPRMLPGRGVI